MQVKTTMRYNLIPVRMANMKKKKEITSVVEDTEEKRALVHSPGGGQKLAQPL